MTQVRFGAAAVKSRSSRSPARLPSFDGIVVRMPLERRIVEVGVGAEAWVHAGVVVDVQPGGVAHVRFGAQLEPSRLREITNGAVTVLAWPPEELAPCDVHVINEAGAAGWRQES